jgi:hypothetical protein
MTDELTPAGQPAARPNLRTAALEADDLGGEPVFVPEWGEHWVAWVRGVTVEERNEALRRAQQGSSEGEDGNVTVKLNTDKFYGLLVVQATLDREGGDPVFSLDDLSMLMAKSAKSVDRLANVVMRLSGMSKASLEEAAAEAGKG